jgi:alpha-1,3-rhamnosyl/mannosyltransferase
MKVGIDLRPLQTPMTGIGTYLYNMVLASMALDPRFELIGYSNFRYRPFDAAGLRKLVAGGTVAGRAGSVLSRAHLARIAYRRFNTYRFVQATGSQRLDIFHAYSFQPLADPGAPVLPVVYDLSFVRYPHMHPKERLAWMARLPGVIARAPMVQTISEFSKREIVEVYGIAADKIFVAYPAPAPLFRPLGDEATAAGIAAFGLSPRKYFLAVGTFEPRKNIRTLIAAFAALSPADRAACPLVIVGGEGWGNLDLPPDTERLTGEGSLRFLREVSNPQLRDLYEGAKIVLLSSVYEGFGLPAVEAFACGTAVAHSEGTSMDEITGGLARRVPAMDVAAWNEVMREAISSHSVAGPHTRHERIARSKLFDWQKSASQISQIYKRFCNS